MGERFRVEGLSLEVADRSAAEPAAREAAYPDAVARARHLAALASSELGEPQEVLEGGVTTGSPRLAKAAVMSAGLEPGERAVTASVTISFELRAAP